MREGLGCDRCRNRRSARGSPPPFPAARWTILKSATGSTNSNRPRRWWSISATASLGLDAQGDPAGRHGGVRLPRRGAGVGSDRGRAPCLRGSPGFRAAAGPRSRPAQRRSCGHRGMAGAAAVLHASPCGARGPDRYRQPDPVFVRPRDRLRRRRRRQFRRGACRHLQGVSRARRDLRYFRRHQRRLGDGGGLCQELRGRRYSSAARTRSLCGAAVSGGRPGRAMRYWITRRSTERSPNNMARSAGSRIAGGRSPRSRPICRATTSN